MKWTFPRAEVLRTMYDKVAKLTERTFITTRPAEAGGQLKSYMLIRIPSGIRDKGDTYQTCRVLFNVFVRDKNSMEDVIGLENIQKQICDMFPMVEKRFTAGNPNIIGSGADSGFHYLIIQCNVHINKKSI